MATVGLSAVTETSTGFAATCQRTIGVDAQVSAGEGAGTLAFTVHTGGCAAAGRVGYTVIAGTAQPGVDFQPAAGYLSWAAGETRDQRITVSIVPDLEPEADLEDFTVQLVTPSSGVRVTSATGHGRIIDDDGFDALLVVDDELCGDPYADVHGGSIYCEPRVIHSAADVMTVHWDTADGTARAGIDYVGVVDRVQTVGPGADGTRLEIRALPRPAGAPSLWFTVRISSVSAGRVVDRVATVTLLGP